MTDTLSALVKKAEEAIVDRGKDGRIRDGKGRRFGDRGSEGGKESKVLQGKKRKKERMKREDKGPRGIGERRRKTETHGR